jgi:hypothetical protein
MYCPGCGYDLRGLSSGRCPECGLSIDTIHSGIIPWERRKGIGYFQSFARTLVTATFRPKHLARATGAPIDLRSARLFRWIVRALVFVPPASLFAFALSLHGGLRSLIIIDSINGPARAFGPFLEPLFLWTAGATFWPALPIGFAVSVILATGISHLFFIKQLDPVRQNRAMAFSFYLCSPLGWIWIPCLAFAAAMVLSNSDWVGSSMPIENLCTICGWAGSLSVLMILLMILNSFRAVSTATQCGIVRCIEAGVGIIVQAIASCALGLLLLPVIVGLFRLMIDSLRR